MARQRVFCSPFTMWRAKYVDVSWWPHPLVLFWWRGSTPRYWCWWGRRETAVAAVSIASCPLCCLTLTFWFCVQFSPLPLQTVSPPSPGPCCCPSLPAIVVGAGGVVAPGSKEQTWGVGGQSCWLCPPTSIMAVLQSPLSLSACKEQGRGTPLLPPSPPAPQSPLSW